MSIDNAFKKVNVGRNNLKVPIKQLINYRHSQR